MKIATADYRRAIPNAGNRSCYLKSRAFFSMNGIRLFVSSKFPAVFRMDAFSDFDASTAARFPARCDLTNRSTIYITSCFRSHIDPHPLGGPILRVPACVKLATRQSLPSAYSRYKHVAHSDSLQRCRDSHGHQPHRRLLISTEIDNCGACGLNATSESRQEHSSGSEGPTDQS